jgi:hypothetical protein
MFALISAASAASAEPLFFDCHGIKQWEPPDGMKFETTEQVMIDPDRGTVDGSTNEYCSKESDWQSGPVGPEVRMLFKIIRSCTNLKVSETAYQFSGAAEVLVKTVRLSGGQSIDEGRSQSWVEGKLNRITGEYQYELREKSANSASPSHYEVLNMTCVPAKGKF